MGKLKLGLKLAKKLVDTAKKVEKPTGASPSKPKPKVKVKKKPMATKINPKSPKDKLEDAVIVGGAIGTAAVLGNKVKEKNKPKKTVKKPPKKAPRDPNVFSKGGMAKKTSTRSKPKGVGAATGGYGRAMR